MKELIVGTNTNISVPASCTKLTIIHEWGDLVAANISVTPSGTYVARPDSIGVHTFNWYSSSNALIQTDYYLGVVLLVSQPDFVADYPAYTSATNFTKYERKVRALIEDFCRQKFGPYVNKTLTVSGQSNNQLFLGLRCNSVTTVTDFFANDITELILLDTSKEYLIRKSISWGYQNTYTNGIMIDHDVKVDMTLDSRSTFRATIDYSVLGNFGWSWVPQDVSEAAKLLIAMEFNPAIQEIRNNRLKQAQLGDYSYTVAGLDDTTGHSQADQLLAPYIVVGLGLA